MIYLDNAATTKPCQKALEYAKKFNSEEFFNPSALYRNGLNAFKDVKGAKETILRCIGATNHEVIFTASGSESDNTAIFCSVKRGVFITDKGEHSAVYKCFKELENRGQKVFYVDLNKDGGVNVNELLNAVKTYGADFVSIMHVNNETGAINDVNAIAKQIKNINKNVIIHVDGVQAFGKLPYRLSLDIDFYSISAHKINGLKGVGALIKKKGVKLTPLIFGGGQEGGFRSGTENVFGIKVFEHVSKEHYLNIKDNYSYVLRLKNELISKLNLEYYSILSGENSTPYILSISAKGLKGEIIMHLLEEKNIIVGNGSACSSKNPISRVIEACGVKSDLLNGVVRISFSIDNTIEQIVIVANELNEIAKNLTNI